ncbi:MAG TPA: right-handed parallel beta-helix repeat-containing protein [Terriglobales bacterium]|nr:right-handed parallel beta-helix repeat-containing protein [Terriglobales bacterium]
MLIVFLIWEETCGCRSKPPQPQTAQLQAEVFKFASAPEVPPRVNFYVSTSGNDRADGSIAHPWKTLDKAAATVTPGAAVHVAPGEYQFGDDELKTTVSGTASARILYVSDVKWGARLRSTMKGNAAVWWNQGDYVDIEGFDISGGGALGIYNEGSHTRIIRNHVHDIPAPGCPENGGAGIDDGKFSGSDDEIIGNTVHDIGEYSLPCQRVHGIYHSNRGGRIVNNLVFHNQGWGIHLWHAATNVVIAGNTVFSNGYGGIVVGADPLNFADGLTPRVNDNTVVENNIVFRNGLRPDARGYGILEYGAVGTRNRYINNVVYQNLPADMKVLRTNETGTVHADPQFVDYQPDGKGDYHLRPASPACSRGWRHSECSS